MRSSIAHPSVMLFSTCAHMCREWSLLPAFDMTGTSIYPQGLPFITRQVSAVAACWEINGVPLLPNCEES